MFGVNIVVLPGRYGARELTGVSFLGPILEKTALEIILANKPVAVNTNYQRDLRYRHRVTRNNDFISSDNTRRAVNAHAEKDIGRALNRGFRTSKEVPKVSTKKKASTPRFTSLSGIRGAISGREVIYRPKKPRLPAWIDTTSPFKMELEFIVSHQGEVKKVTPIVSSGNVDVDLLGIRYLKGWRFAQLPQVSNEETGRIKFIFEEDGSEKLGKKSR